MLASSKEEAKIRGLADYVLGQACCCRRNGRLDQAYIVARGASADLAGISDSGHKQKAQKQSGKHDFELSRAVHERRIVHPTLPKGHAHVSRLGSNQGSWAPAKVLTPYGQTAPETRYLAAKAHGVHRQVWDWCRSQALTRATYSRCSLALRYARG